MQIDDRVKFAGPNPRHKMYGFEGVIYDINDELEEHPIDGTHSAFAVLVYFPAKGRSQWVMNYSLENLEAHALSITTLEADWDID
jgi:hypothetical protein